MSNVIRSLLYVGKKIGQKQKLSLILIVVFFLSLNITYQVMKPFTFEIRFTTTTQENMNLLNRHIVARSFVRGEEIKFTVKDIDSPIDLYFYFRLNKNYSQTIIKSFYDITGEFRYKYKVMTDECDVSFIAVSKLNLTRTYFLTVSVYHTTKALYYADGVLGLVTVFSVLSPFLFRVKLKELSEDKTSLVKQLRKGSRPKTDLLPLYHYELKSFNYSLFVVMILVVEVWVTDFSSSYSIITNVGVSMIQQYFHEFILYDHLELVLVLLFASIALLSSSIREETHVRNLHDKSLIPISGSVVFARSLAMTTVLMWTWSLLVGYALYVKYVLYYDSSAVQHGEFIGLVILTMLCIFFVYSFLYYSLELWVPTQLKWFLPAVLYLTLFRIDFLFEGPGWLLLLWYAFLKNPLVYTLIVILSSGVLIVFSLLLVRERKRTFVEGMRYYRYFAK